jgi:hypothetical protein
MKHRCIFIIALLLFLFAQISRAQNEENKQFFVRNKFHEKGMMIRWAPAETWLFEMAQKSGYKLERALVEENAPSKWIFNKSWVILPMEKKNLENKVDTSDKYQLIAASLLYGKKADSLRKAPLINPRDPNEIALRNSYQENRRFFGLLAADFSFTAAEMLGLGYKDMDVEEGKVYVYRLSPQKTPKGIKPDTLTFFASAIEDPARPKLKLSGKSLEKKVRILWEKEGESGYYSGFNIYKSSDGITFEKMNALPYKPLNSNTEDQTITQPTDSSNLIEKLFYHSYMDSLGVNYKQFYYTLEGIDAFGLKSIISDTVVIMGKDLTPPEAVVEIKTKKETDKTLRISWENPFKQSTDVAGIYVEKGIRDDENTFYNRISGDKLLPASSTAFADNNPISSNICYYRVNVVDTSGNVAYSIPQMYAVEDLEPPQNPERITGILDTTGILTITFARSKSRDAKRYMFYYAFEENDEFIPFDSYGTEDTSFVLTNFPIRQLNKYFFVKVITLDIAGNMSVPTAPIKVKIPDIIPPLTPTLQQTELRDKTLYAKYEKSGSNDVLHYLIQRSVDNRVWRTFETRPAKAVKGLFLEILDTVKEHGVYHRVRVIAVDESNLQSEPSEFTEGRVTGKDRSMPCKNLTVQYDSKLNRTELNWTHDESARTRYSIYRRVNNGKNIFLGNTESIGLFIDRKIEGKGSYTYIIVATTADKGDSNPLEASIVVQ